LKERLRDLRQGIDRYHEVSRQKNPGAAEEALYPATLEELTKARILRKIPIDPMTGEATWGTRSSSDPGDAIETDGRNVFDVRSLATGTSFDGSAYSNW
ncbi:MAG TPA: general secretion pathway protein GspG, partial [Candidatus Ozemobacteraceae bacterium]|nr:general secretion pathway protein GspG [Candidatus Ozemobacteraceae bacterium]